MASSRRPGTRNPWKRTGENSIQSPDQLIRKPMMPVKIGMDTKANQSSSLAQSLNQSTPRSSP